PSGRRRRAKAVTHGDAATTVVASWNRLAGELQSYDRSMGRPRDERGRHGWPVSRSGKTAATTAAGGEGSLQWFVSSGKERKIMAVESLLKVEERKKGGAGKRIRIGRGGCARPITYTRLARGLFSWTLGPAWRANRPNVRPVPRPQTFTFFLCLLVSISSSLHHRAISHHYRWSKEEHSAVLSTATDSTAQELSEWNAKYWDKFGFVFMICASKRTAPEVHKSEAMT
uniref:2-oxo-4-hydroxy-4-carboxy-5-ureidoimidazoline decarboxylase n=1 Tax=Aegilops tauschii subsp. strangulata TaxID=200361 RepID=A0A453IHB5_AEGTS